MSLVLSAENVEQPPLANANLRCEITVAVASLSIGGAERIILDWAARIYPRWRVHLIVLRNREHEWPVPSFIRVTRVENSEVFNHSVKIGVHECRLEQLAVIGREVASSSNPICVCHLLR